VIGLAAVLPFYAPGKDLRRRPIRWADALTLQLPSVSQPSILIRKASGFF
jgi:hypothetical protein